jgi:hypothetical protein
MIVKNIPLMTRKGIVIGNVSLHEDGRITGTLDADVLDALDAYIHHFLLDFADGITFDFNMRPAEPA